MGRHERAAAGTDASETDGVMARTIGWYRAQRRQGVAQALLVGHALQERLLAETVRLKDENRRLRARLKDEGQGDH